jgi:IPT/TIG domain
MRPPVSRILLLVCALLAVVPATAGAATAPKVTSVAPLTLKIGQRLTIRGTGFLAGRNRNTIVFKATGSPAVFAKAQSATTTKIVVRVPAKLLSFLKATGGRSVATRFQIRVLAKRLSPSYTPAAKSPVIAPATPIDAAPATPGAAPSNGAAGASGAASAAATPSAPAPVVAAQDCDRDGTPDAIDTDDDNDLLLDTVEARIGTDPCNPDSDGDTMTDGWEYKSALDLYNRSCRLNQDYPAPCAAVVPSPSTRDYPNPLNYDANTDYDGDGLTAKEEFDAWSAKATKDPAWRNLTNLWYSDGLQASQDTSAPNDGCVGIPAPAVPFNGLTTYAQFDWGPSGTAPDLSDPAYRVYSLDRVGRHAGDGCLDDAERDEDGDFLTNWDETHGGFSDGTWWQRVYDEPAYPVSYGATSFLNPDSNNNGVVDGLDDADHDDFLNVEEVTRGPQSHTGSTDLSARSGLWVDPYNPCLPSVESRTCATTLLLDMEAWRPFKKKASDAAAAERWPLYPMATRTATHYGYLPYQGAGTDEIWDSAGFSSTMPPLHPLPRPGIAYQ